MKKNATGEQRGLVNEMPLINTFEHGSTIHHEMRWDSWASFKFVVP